MKSSLFVLFVLLILASVSFSQESLSGEISEQASIVFHRLSGGSRAEQIITAQDMAASSVVQEITDGVSAEQVCLSPGYYRSDPNWLLGPGGSSLRYVGNEDQELEFFVFCEKGSKLAQAAQFFSQDRINERFISHCPQLTPDNEDAVCVVVLTKSVPTGGGYNFAYELFFIFAVITIFPLLYVFRAENIQLKLFVLIKLLFISAVFIVFYFLGFVLSTLTLVLLLFFFFVQINLSIAPLVLGFESKETSTVKLVLQAVLIIEVVGLAVSVILISPFL